MTITSTNSSYVSSKESQIIQYVVTAWAQNDVLTITHARDSLNARKVSVITTSTGVTADWDSTNYTVTFASSTTTTVKALAASPVAVKITVTVPAN